MALKIRLARGGTKNLPYYRIVIADSRSPRDGRFIEKIGTHNPLLPHDHADRLRVDADLFKEWYGKGARPTDRVARLLSTLGLTEKPYIARQTKKDQPKAKAQERAAAKIEKARAAAEAEEQAKNTSAEAAE